MTLRSEGLRIETHDINHNKKYANLHMSVLSFQLRILKYIQTFENLNTCYFWKNYLQTVCLV